jgi:hypothetical protein
MTPLLELTDDYTEELRQDWIEAELDAIAAYDVWVQNGDRDSYVVYRAYADQADAAQDALAAASFR